MLFQMKHFIFFEQVTLQYFSAYINAYNEYLNESLISMGVKYNNILRSVISAD